MNGSVYIFIFCAKSSPSLLPKSIAPVSFWAKSIARVKENQRKKKWCELLKWGTPTQSSVQRAKIKRRTSRSLGNSVKLNFVMEKKNYSQVQFLTYYINICSNTSFRRNQALYACN